MKQNAKRLIVLFVLLATAFSLVGCSQKEYIKPPIIKDDLKPQRPDLNLTTTDDILVNTKILEQNYATVIQYAKDLEVYIKLILDK
ncbi:exported hypothetical protein [Sulfurovum sp. enrichment culture clone C5]|uniref:Lipoprotein n=1 Tax=Sulfurovum sp. enrichment culture clone C5 TaxID=497650 RepID=A0A0S4XLP3_9BACT|nr:exported hypothetical protein [Sulfurovum sp. enrichment culture clone C5]